MALRDIEGLTRHDAPTLSRLADALRPRRRVRPSAWAEEFVHLDKIMTSGYVGPYRCDAYPWLRSFLDALYEHPEKKGVVCPKRAQGGITIATQILMACWAATQDGFILYLIGNEKQSKEIVDKKWDRMVPKIPALQRRFDIAKEEGQMRQILQQRSYDGGRIDFLGAGSASAVSTWTYPLAVVDEYDEAQAVFPSSQFGDIYPFVQGRQSADAIATTSQMYLFGHPTDADVGIMKLWTDESDRGRWAFDCPHGRCGKPVAPTSELIRYKGTTLTGEKDPYSAVLECPYCGLEIADSQRAKAVEPPERNGTGRRWTDLPVDQAARAPLLGFGINGLCSPNKSVRHFASLLVSGERGGESAMKSTLNVHFGEGSGKKKGAITEDIITRVVVPGRRIGTRFAVPGGPMGVRMVTVGADVQFYSGAARPDAAGGKLHLFYVAAIAWAASGIGYVIDLSQVIGWTALYRYLAEVAAIVGEESPNAGELIPVSALGIDSRYETRDVLSHCRERLYSPIDNRRIELIAQEFDPSLKRDRPVVVPSDERRTDKTRPHLGMVDRFLLHRHTWVDRAIQRISAERLIVLCDAPKEFKAHCMANQLRPVKTTHGWDSDRVEWWRPDEVRDDWLQGLVNAEAVAAIRCDLDSIHELGIEPTEGPRIIAPSGWGRPT